MSENEIKILRESLDNIFKIYYSLNGRKFQLLKDFLPDGVYQEFGNRICIITDSPTDSIYIEVTNSRLSIYINNESVYDYDQMSDGMDACDKVLFDFIQEISGMLSNVYEQYENRSSNISKSHEKILNKAISKLKIKGGE